MASVLGGLVLLMLVFAWVNRLAATRGHRGPWPGWLVVASYFATLGAALATGQQSIWLYPVGTLVLVAAVVAGVRLLPRRARHSGIRPASRAPYAALAWLCGAGALAALLGVYGLFQTRSWTLIRLLPVLLPGAIIGALLLIDAAVRSADLARRQRAPGLEEVARRDPRAPVVFLRTFLLDEQRVRRRFLLVLPTTDTSSLEELLATPVHRSIGPLVAIGNPTDYLPTFGAIKTYERDDDWQATVAGLVARAVAVVVVEGATDGLRWELTHLRASKELSRVFVLTAPASMRTSASTTWPGFARALVSAGFQPPATDPGPGAVLGFDASGASDLIAQGCRGGDDYARAIETALNELPSPKPASPPPGSTAPPRRGWLTRVLPRFGSATFLLSLVALAVLAVVLRLFVVVAFKAPSGSMRPGIAPGARLWINRLARVQRGDVIAFHFPPEPRRHFLKRVIAVGGERVRVANGVVFVNGIALPHQPLAGPCVVVDRDEGSAESRERRCARYRERLGWHSYTVLALPDQPQPDFPETVVPPGHFFVLGDHRDNSHDSRHWGFVPASKVIGVPF